ncbi:site-specific integrase [Azospirillum brasilense]|uniref:site-specific integrase n=1 Tax=Azospirillum brasilense TaxID=192 RepID=UPI001EDBAEEE|nr:site-specific integrase [Azospirillum brasilense]UKJ75455.1 site-specific integrase [Azospirillum brasilense]
MLPTPHLFQRGTVWWWRRRIPKNFSAYFRRRETVVSLRTNIPAEALARAARLRAATDALFDGVRQAMALGLTMSKAQMDAIILDLVHHEIEAAELARALAPPRSPGEAEAAVARARALRGEMQAALRLNELDAARGPLDATLARLQMALAPEMPDYRLLLRKAAWGLANEVASAHEQHESGTSATGAFFAPPAAAAAPGALVLATATGPAPAAPAPPVSWPREAAVPEPPAAPAMPPARPAPPEDRAAPPAAGAEAPPAAVGVPPPRSSTLTIGEAFDGLIAEKSSSASWVTNMRRKVEASRRLFVEAVGDRPLDTIEPEDIDRFRAIIERLPANHGKSAQDRRTASDVADATDAEEQDRIDELEERHQLGELTRADFVERRDRLRIRRLTSTTLNLHLDRVKAAIDWAIKKKRFAGPNPAQGKRLDDGERDARDRDVPRRDREPWGHDGVRALFASPAFQGDGLRTDAFFWAPLVTAHAGLRPEEALQLHVADIHQKDGVWCFRVCDGPGKTCKTRSSKRDVPIHRMLLELGILELAALRRRENVTRLFADVERGASYERFSDLFSKDFGRYTRAHGLYRPGNDHYSLRKDFNVRLREAEVVVGARKRLMGHSIKDLTDGTYDPAGETMAKLREYVNRIDHGVRVGPNRRLHIEPLADDAPAA